MKSHPAFQMEVCEGALLIRLNEALTLEFADEFRNLVLEEITAGRAYRGIVVDLGACEYLDSTGIGAFIVLKMKYKHAERLRLARVTAVVNRIFKATGFDLVIPLEPDVKSALAHLPDDAITLAG